MDEEGGSDSVNVTSEAGRTETASGSEGGVSRLSEGGLAVGRQDEQESVGSREERGCELVRRRAVLGGWEGVTGAGYFDEQWRTQLCRCALCKVGGTLEGITHLPTHTHIFPTHTHTSSPLTHTHLSHSHTHLPHSHTHIFPTHTHTSFPLTHTHLPTHTHTSSPLTHTYLPTHTHTSGTLCLYSYPLSS